MAAEWPWPSGGTLAALLKELARPHETLWLGWWEAWFVERQCEEQESAIALPPWVGLLPEGSVPSARLRKLRIASLPPGARRKFSCYLDSVWGGFRLPLERAGAPAYPRVLPLDRQSGLELAGNAQSLDQITWCVPVYLPLACSLGSKVRLTLLEPASWANRPVMQLERSEATLLVQRLVPPAAAAWAEAWSVVARGLGLRQPLSSPFETDARGPVLPLKLPRGDQHKVEGVWLLAGDGNLRAVAKVVPA